MTTPPRALPGERRVFAARLAALTDAAAFAQDFCDRRRVAPDVALRLTLAIEELFTNTVTHGHGGDSDAPIAITLGVADAGVTLCYEDAAPCFDPRPRMQTPPTGLDAPVDRRGVGGLGLRLVGQMAIDVRHAFVGGNRLQLTLPTAAAGAGR